MFISLSDIIAKHNMHIRGVLHVGAHQLEERDTYKQNNINDIVWIEGNDELIPKCQEIISADTQASDIILNYLVYNEDGKDLTFNISNNTQSSSLLPFGKHKQYYSYIDYVKTTTKTAFTLQTILRNNNIAVEKYNMINLDLQGVELKALQGLGDMINAFDYIYTEINNDTIYIGNDLINDLDAYLSQHNFTRVETFMLSEQWGDALYIRNNLPR